MALTRKMLKAMDIDAEKIDEIIEAHTETTDALKKERDAFKEDAAKLPDVQKELDGLKKSKGADDSYKEKYEKEHKDYEDYKKQIQAEKTKASKTEAYKALLKKAGVSDKRIDSVLKVTSMDDVELDDKGEVKDADKKVEAIKQEWADFIVKTEEQGAGTETPPSGAGAGGGKTLSRAAQVVAKRNEMLYGVKGDDKK